jgi:hypothetical protein
MVSQPSSHSTSHGDVFSASQSQPQLTESQLATRSIVVAVPECTLHAPKLSKEWFAQILRCEAIQPGPITEIASRASTDKRVPVSLESFVAERTVPDLPLLKGWRAHYAAIT